MAGSLIIGSTAAKHHYPEFREPADLDIATLDYKNNTRGIEMKPIAPLLHYLADNSLDLDIATPEILYTLKLSHAEWNIHWGKTMADIKFFQEKNIRVIPELYKSLFKHWEEVHGKKNVTLDKPKEKFFTPGVKRVIDHDTLHSIMAYYDKPLYQTILKDDQEVLTDYNKFILLSHENQIKLAREEIYVIALERYAIPFNMKVPKKAAYFFSCRDLVTRMTKGWFPKFIINNWSELYQPEIDYFSKFNNNLCLIKN
jgi:hypothetical protein